jgi:hypothetical protein
VPHYERVNESVFVTDLFRSVGPYRECISQLCRELQTAGLLPLLIPCPNQQQSGVGENREKFLLNPGSNQFAMFEFFGKLMGIAIRSKNPLALDLPSMIWKPLVCVGCPKFFCSVMCTVDPLYTSIDKIFSGWIESRPQRFERSRFQYSGQSGTTRYV